MRKLLTVSLAVGLVAGCRMLAGAPAPLAPTARPAQPLSPGAPALDPFGVAMLNPTVDGGREWFAKWDSDPRILRNGRIDPLDPGFQNRGSDSPFQIAGDGGATVSGRVIRQYLWDQPTDGGTQRRWGNIELTFYAMRVSEDQAPSYAGFITEVRTDDGHVTPAPGNDALRCLGSSYSLAMYYDGRAEFKKELQHPNYTSSNPSVNIWDGGEVPYGQWIGFKAVVRDVDGGVDLQLYRDLTDGAAGGSWELVLEYVDSGGWRVMADGGGDLCGLPSDRILTGAYPVVLLRNDSSTMRYKKASVREITP